MRPREDDTSPLYDDRHTDVIRALAEVGAQAIRADGLVLEPEIAALTDLLLRFGSPSPTVSARMVREALFLPERDRHRLTTWSISLLRTKLSLFQIRRVLESLIKIVESDGVVCDQECDVIESLCDSLLPNLEPLSPPLRDTPLEMRSISGRVILRVTRTRAWTH